MRFHARSVPLGSGERGDRLQPAGFHPVPRNERAGFDFQLRQSPAAGTCSHLRLKIPLHPMQSHPNDPLHGVTLVDRHGWEHLADRIPIRCFMFDPSIKSSLTFLRKPPWARKRLEDWFVYDSRRGGHET